MLAIAGDGNDNKRAVEAEEKTAIKENETEKEKEYETVRT